MAKSHISSRAHPTAAAEPPAQAPSSGAAGGAVSATYWEAEAELDPESEPLWSLFLFDQGATGAELLEESEYRLRIRHFFDELQGTEARTWPERFRTNYPGVRPPRGLTISRKPRENWGSAWRAHFAPLAVGERWLIRPPWADDEANEAARQGAGRTALTIDPGQGFGTGRHPTTALVLEMLETLLAHPPRPGRMVDVGTGSGILAIAARMLGVPEVWAIDIDRRVMAEVRRNFRLNGLVGPDRLIQGAPRCLRVVFPLVVANLVTPVLLEERAALAVLTAPGGVLILSGILASELPDVVATFAASGCPTMESRQREGWVALRLQRTP